MITLRAIKRIVILVVGGTVLLFGIALLVLPGPAFVVIPVGLAILAVEFAWARRCLRKASNMLPDTNGAGGFPSYVVRHVKNFLEWASVTSTREHQRTDRTKGQKDEARKQNESAVTG